MLTSLGPLALAVVTSLAVAEPPAPLPSHSIEARLGLARPQLRLAAAELPAGTTTPAADPFDEPPGYLERSAVQRHEDGRFVRVLVGAPSAVVAVGATAFVASFMMLGAGFAGNEGLFIGSAIAGVLLVPAASAGTMVLVGSMTDGQGGFGAAWLGGLGGAVLGVGGSVGLGLAVDGAAGLGGLFLAVPLFTAAGSVIAYELSSASRAEALDYRHGRSRRATIVPLLAPTKDGAIGGLAVAF